MAGLHVFLNRMDLGAGAAHRDAGADFTGEDQPVGIDAKHPFHDFGNSARFSATSGRLPLNERSLLLRAARVMGPMTESGIYGPHFHNGDGLTFADDYCRCTKAFECVRSNRKPPMVTAIAGVL